MHQLASELGRVAPERTRIYLTGGATAVLAGWRQTTVDIDLYIEPESDALLRRLAELKEELHAAIESQLFRFPNIDPAILRRKLEAVLSAWDGE